MGIRCGWIQHSSGAQRLLCHLRCFSPEPSLFVMWGGAVQAPGVDRHGALTGWTHPRESRSQMGKTPLLPGRLEVEGTQVSPQQGDDREGPQESLQRAI